MNFVLLANSVKAAAHDAGFDVCGISAAGEFRELEYFPHWIAEGRAGEMEYLAKRDEQGRLKRSSLAIAAPWARSVVVCAINYNSKHPYSTEITDPTKGWISRYAWTDTDYHDAVLRRLREVEAKLVAEVGADAEVELRTWCYVDTGPIVERVFAQHSGVGWVGKNTCIINQELGSWLFLGVILTSLELVPDLPAPDRCGSCRACLDACPTEAFIAPYKLDATKCISYLTIEKRGEIAEELREGMGRHLFGCDICQDVCPWNREAPVGTAPEFAPREGLQAPSLEWMAKMTQQEFRETFRHSPVKRAKYSGLRRNTAIAMGNSGNLEFIEHLLRLAEDDDLSVAEHARWALEQLERHRQAKANETDPFKGRTEMKSGPELYVDSGANRKYPRYKVDMRAKVIVRENGRDETIYGRTSHLSVGGLGMTLTKELDRGAQVILEFKLPQCEVFKMRAELRYRSGFKCGFQFLEVSAEQRSLIKAFCSELPLK